MFNFILSRHTVFQVAVLGILFCISRSNVLDLIEFWLILSWHYLTLSVLLTLAILVAHCGFSLHFLDDLWCWTSFLGLLAIWYFLWLFTSFVHLKNLEYPFLIDLYIYIFSKEKILLIYSFVKYMVCKCFLIICGLHFHFPNCALWRANLSHFDSFYPFFSILHFCVLFKKIFF